MDFYPNGGSEQPGCDTNFVCSHSRAPELFARTIADENAQKYMACKYEEAPCNDEKNPAYMPMGYHRKFDDPHGKFYLETKSESDVVSAFISVGNKIADFFKENSDQKKNSDQQIGGQLIGQSNYKLQ